MKPTNLQNILGPGLLFAGAAVGVSHLVQSTRAGAHFGLALVAIVIVANILKYPAFSFGPRYAAATGKSLIEGYRRQGQWALWLYAILTLGTMFTVMAVVALVTAALLKGMFATELTLITLSAIVMAFSSVLVTMGGFVWLDRVIKVFVAILTVCTLIATTMVVGHIDFSGPWWPSAEVFDGAQVLFIAGLIGWMPSAIDVAAWHSLWTLAKSKTSGHKPTIRESMFDFNVGYIGTAVLAVCFLLLGAGVMQGHDVPTSAPGFANAVVNLYVATLGEWSGPVIGLAAFLVMLSTTVTVTDGFPRAIACLFRRFKGPEEEGEDVTDGASYRIAVIVLVIGALVVLIGFLGKGSFMDLVDLATGLSFMTAPVLAFLNHRAVLSAEIPEDKRPSPRMVIYSWVGIVFLSGFCLAFFVLRFG
jgi:Mn2+/Fe2+ NRAMP family transporter